MFGGNATLGPRRTAQALSQDSSLTATFSDSCARARRMLGLPDVGDDFVPLGKGEPAYMQCAFGILEYASLVKARDTHGSPDVYAGMSVGNTIGCFASLGLDMLMTAVYCFLRGHFMQASAMRVGMYGPPYDNLVAIDLGEGSSHNYACEVQRVLVSEFANRAGVAIFRHGGITCGYVGGSTDYQFQRFGAVKPLNEMGYHLPFAMQEAADVWYEWLQPLCTGPLLDDRFWSGMHGHFTQMGPSRRDRIEAICTELRTPFGWDMMCDQLHPKDTVVHLGVRVGRRDVDLLRGITPLPSDVAWHLVT